MVAESLREAQISGSDRTVVWDGAAVRTSSACGAQVLYLSAPRRHCGAAFAALHKCGIAKRRWHMPETCVSSCRGARA